MLILLSLLILSSFLTLTPLAKVVVLVAIALIALQPYLNRFLPLNARFSAASITGLFVPILPMAGFGALLPVALSFVCVNRTIFKWSELAWIAPFVLTAAGSTFAIFIFGIAPQTYEAVFYGLVGPQSESGLTALLHFLNLAAPENIRAVNAFSTLILSLLFFTIFSRALQIRLEFISGLKFGVAISALITLGQLTDIVPLLQPNPFWSSIGRISGTFTDPNAFGVFAFLIIGFILSGVTSQNGVLQLLSGSFFVLALFSGSRSFFLGVIITLISLLYSRKRRLSYLIITTAIIALLIINLPDPSYYQVLNLPIGVERLCNSLRLSQLSETLFSRFALWRVGWQIWIDHFAFGVGADGVRSLVPLYSSVLGIGIGGWFDNANNFYLDLLAQFGLVGGVFFLLSISKLQIKHEEVYADTLIAVLHGFIAMLFFGPHLEFVEVGVLFGLLCSYIVKVKPISQYWNITLCACLSSFFLLFQGYFSERGFYAYELDENGKPFRWSAQSATVNVACDEGGIASLVIRASNPDLAVEPLKLKLRTDFGELVEAEMREPLRQEFKFHCRNPNSLVNATALNIGISVSRSWSPYAFGLGADRRVLGVQIHEP